MAAISEREQRTGKKNTDGSGGVETWVIREINAATAGLENLTPQAKKMTRRAFCFTAIVVAGGLAAAEYERQQQANYYKKLRSALAPFGIQEVELGAGSEWVNFPSGKIVQETSSRGNHLYFLNLSKYEVYYNKAALFWVGPYIDYPGNAFVFRNELIDSSRSIKPGTVVLGEKEFMGLAAKQKIVIPVGLSGRDIAMDEFLENLYGKSDVSGLSDIEKDALGLLLGIQMTVFSVLRLKYSTLFSQLDTKSADESNPEVQKQIKERDEFEMNLREKLFSGKLKPWFKVSIK